MQDRNHFELFGLPVKQALDNSDLERRHQALQMQVHPDRFVQNEADSLRRVAERNAATVNEAYSVLANPLTRAAYLLSLRGNDPFAESGGSKLPPDFLERQLELREELEDIAQGGDAGAAASFVARLRKEMDAELAALADLLDNRPDDPVPAVQCAQRLRYLQNCHSEARRLVKD